MDATLVLIDSDADLARARALVDRLWESDEPADIARLQAQSRLIAAYEESKWPRRSPSTADLIRHLMDQHGLSRADMVPILGAPSRVSRSFAARRGSAWQWCRGCAPKPEEYVCSHLASSRPTSVDKEYSSGLGESPDSR